MSARSGPAHRQDESPLEYMIRSARDTLLTARRRPLLSLGLPLAGALLGVVVALLIPARYPSSAAFVPDTDNTRLPLSAGLASLASQFGVAGSKGDSPQFYADLLRNRDVQLPIIGRRYDHATGQPDSTAASVAEQWGVRKTDTPIGRDAALRAFNQRLHTEVNPRTGVVSFTVEASTPALAQAIARDLLAGVNEFNIGLRRSRAAAQQAFFAERARDARNDLRAAEDSLRWFLTTNRAFQGSPFLQFEEARLRRSVELQQTLFVNLRQQLDQMTLDAARNTPALNVLSTPLLVTKRSYPNRRLIVATMLLASIAVTAVLLRSGASAGAKESRPSRVA